MDFDFDINFQRDRIQEMCKILRVLNAVRSPEIGIPLSIQQYKLLTPSVLIGRLITAHQHLLALKISEYLGMNQELVIKHWACSKITASLAIPDAALLELLLDKMMEDAVHFLGKETVIQAVARSTTKLCLE
ncbi:Vacuolar protein sorting-associated protein 16 [Vigna unguiculata]|uniref:Vacuolar protein sorting-associated protein 16 n=1 Tax=Vigna unguiculata TaxID=3917 RepID=A0A4D6M0Y2_VIGUN|nr:Vacuolar protein sorting-associated protein 16 [Vigna unguiculata]